MSRILIKRRGHNRKGYAKRQYGKRVRIGPTRVKAAIYLAKDKGLRGRTRKGNRWFKGRRVRISAYSTKLPTKKRRAVIRKDSDSAVKKYHRLLGLANVQKRINPRASATFMRDANWAKRNLLTKRQKRMMTSKARAVRR